MAAAVIPTNPSLPKAFSRWKSSSQHQNPSGCTDSELKQAGCPFPPSPTETKMFMQHSSKQISAQRGFPSPGIFRTLCKVQVDRILAGFVYLFIFFLPWQREFFQCQEDHTSEYSCRGFYSFLYFSWLWQCPSHVLPTGAGKEKELNIRNRKSQKEELHLPGSQISTCRKEAALQAQAFKV